jgi:hypothetical protein
MPRVAAPAAVLACLLAAVPPADAQPRPAKAINIKADVGLDYVHPLDDSTICSAGPRMLFGFGLETASFPWYAGMTFYTNVAFELAAGAFLPAVQMGRGWLVFTAAPFFLATRESEPADPAAGCGGTVLEEMYETAGLSVTAEYLLYDGYLGFFVEVKQTFFEPVATRVLAGVDVSPLLWLLWRNQ